MKLHPQNNLTYKDWRIRVAVWGQVPREELDYYKHQRKPIPAELQEKRRAHMKQLHEQGAPYAWIGKLYNMTRTHAYRIINGLPNN